VRKVHINKMYISFTKLKNISYVNNNNIDN
jgi:hypothetical protein